MNMKKNEINNILVTGAAGFIGYYLTRKLLDLDYNVIGVDNLNDYYDVNLKLARLQELGFTPDQTAQTLAGKTIELEKDGHLIFYPADLKDRERIDKIFDTHQPDVVVNLAAQAGVRYSLENPYAYIDSNISGFINILENCRRGSVKHLVYASSSSVYGSNKTMPFSVHHNVDHPVSLYAATKKSNELMAHSYSHLYKIPTTGLRFFTVYGPWGRPDMAYFIFSRKILNNEPIDVFNHGKMKRDFTYIDDIVQGVYRTMMTIPEGNTQWDGYDPDPATSLAPYRVFNIGNNQPVDLLYFIQLLEKNLGKEAEKRFLPLQKGDVEETYADTSALEEYADFHPTTSIEDGIARFVQWYRNYYDI